MGFLKIIEEVAEQRIRQAQDEGQFDNLSGSGRPLVLEDDSMIPEDLRMAYKILKNSGHVPPHIAEEKEIRTALDMLEQCGDEQTRYRQIQKINYLIMKINEGRRRPIELEKHQLYFDKAVAGTSVNVQTKGQGQGRPDGPERSAKGT